MNTANMTPSSEIDIKPHWLTMVLAILREHIPDHEVRAFGSRVRGQPRPFSDLDLAICGDVPLDDATLVDLRDAFEESDLPIVVDVVPMWLAGPHIVSAVIEQGIIIHKPNTTPVQEVNPP